MKLKKFIAMAAMLFASVMFYSPPIHAQDTTAPPTVSAPVVTPPSQLGKDTVILKTIDSVLTTIPISQITAPSTVTIFGIKMPMWAGIAIIALMIVLPAVQLVLKKIPSAAPIEGAIGAILNIFTIFQKNITVAPIPPDKTT